MIQKPSDKARARPEKEPHVRMTIKIPESKAQQIRERAILGKHRSVAAYIVHMMEQDKKAAP